MFDYYDNGNKLFVDADIYLNCCEIKVTPLHAHSFVEIAFIAKGEGIHKIGELTQPCKSGEIYIINHDVPHQFIAENQSELEIYNCVFKPSFFDFSMIDSKIFFDITYGFLIKIIGNEKMLKTPKITLLGDSFQKVFTLYQEMLYEYSMKDEGYLEILKGELIRLIVYILRAMKNMIKESDTHSKKDHLIEKSIDYIHSNFSKDLTLEELSMQAFLSRSHFCRLFKEYTGITVKEFMRRIRINEACRLLSTTNKKIADIAYEVGYNDNKNFSFLFKKLVGKTPKEYRKTI